MVHVAGYDTCQEYQQVVTALNGLAVLFPTEISVEVTSFPNSAEYNSWLTANRSRLGSPSHTGSPFVWFEEGAVLGGINETLQWCRTTLSGGQLTPIAPLANVDQWNPAHDFDYDLIVIGGGSGGLACAKEAVTANPDLRVALCDFVKPSPRGTKWGLGGTCVNVGCIPKKLMHTAALLGDASNDAMYYGWEGNSATHSWERLRDNSQDHIKGLNFGYRVELREKGVSYLNKLAKFVDPHTVEISDKKGSKTISGARIVVAVGCRPQPLTCPGGELAITSDDLFTLASPPGKTCVIGAGYVALECAGFIKGLGQSEVTVAVRSILLRGFDREMAEKVHDAMEHLGVQFKIGVVPESVSKLTNGRLLVRLSNGDEDEFDTVLCATGRYADCTDLNLAAAGVQMDSRSGKIVCANEQTSVPHIYAIGDVVQGVPELTPAAIQAGIYLARRLFAGKQEVMDYSMVATTVFTPLELGTVGLSEEAAIEKYGASAIDCVVSSFQPLEWTICENRAPINCFAKIVLNTSRDDEVVGLHVASPSAGEIMQGLAVAFRKGLKFSDLNDTVGIHPTTAEEFTVMTIRKSSGASAEKKGC